jgi:threonine synthase
VGSAAEGKAGVRAVILFPKGRVSAFQERQLTCWNAPVRALRVAGDFDACQHLVKEAFADPDLRRAMHLTSANSINLGRLLPQMVAIASAALQIEEKTGEKPGLVVPTGNLGHGVAALYARAMGVPVGPVVLATNANATLSDWFGTGRFEPRASIKTLANAMDVGAPSNFERLAALPEDAAQVRVSRVEDEAIRARIHADYTASGYVWCPHSACGAQAYAQLSEAERAERPWLVLACAHPFKFADVVEPIIGASLTPPEALAGVLDRETQATDIEADLASLADALDAHSEANQPHAA